MLHKPLDDGMSQWIAMDSRDVGDTASEKR